MTKPFEQRAIAVPSGRLSRGLRMGGLTTGMVGRMALGGAAQLLRGQSPDPRKLLVTPANIRRLTEELAHMRGAAMKVGQLMSMEAGDLLPPELAQVLAHLRADAHYMPPGQLKDVLTRAYGPDFRKRFLRFDVRPIAAASIGQVHRAQTRDGRDLALKVQYPGVRRSIDADVRNVGQLVRLSGLAPAGLDLGPYLDEARRQLHDEADYGREARYLERFRALLADDDGFLLPGHHADLSTADILAMDFVPGAPIETLGEAAPDLRDRLMSGLVRLCLRELFEFRLMQTDPNFANYRWDPQTGRLVLLDFGAAQDITPELSDGFRKLLQAGRDGQGVSEALIGLGLLGADTPPGIADRIIEMTRRAMAPLFSETAFDFADTALIEGLRDEGMALSDHSANLPVPPMAVLYVQRKIAGLYLLATRLGARMALRPLMDEMLEG